MQTNLMRAKRIAAFDVARGLAVFFMALVHALNMYASPQTADSVFGWVIEFLGSAPAAPVFMFLMGAVLAFSRRTGFLTMVRRGLFLWALGYLLNALRASLPLWIAIQAGVPLEELGGATPLTELLSVDILQFAGLATLVLAVVRRITRKPWVWIGLAAVVAGVSPLIWGFETGVPVLDGIFALLGGGDGEGVAFPLFAWLAYPLVGMAVGRWLATAEDRAMVFRRMAWIGLGLSVVGGVLTLTDIDFHLGDYWRTGPGGVITITGYILLWIWGLNLIADKVLRTRPGKMLAFWSRNVTVFYFIHWVLLGWSVLLVGYEAYGPVGTLVGFVLIATLSTLLTCVWIRVRRRVGGHKP